ncbi:MAG TPA: metallopeptidase family protein [Candidatus Binatia bacterium]|nr:metallopeptidase family protein [Candidatus Binatia bacterium]
MDRRKFRRLIEEALDTLPGEIRVRMENVTVFVEEEPTLEQIQSAGLDPMQDTLFGFYEGSPLSGRGHDFGMALPDRIVLFYRPLVESCRSPAAIREEIRRTVVHEVAHFLGLGDDEIEDLGY